MHVNQAGCLAQLVDSGDKTGVQEPLQGHLRFLCVNLARHPASFTSSLVNAH